MGTTTVVHFEIPAKDVDTLRRFYSEVFGGKIESMGVPGVDYWRIETGPRGKSVGGGLYPKRDSSIGARNVISVDRIDEAIERFLRSGGAELTPKTEIPGVGWSFVGEDPEGNPIGMLETKRAPTKARRPRAAKAARPRVKPKSRSKTRRRPRR